MTDLSPAMQMQCHRVSQKACDTIFGLLTDGWKMQESKTTKSEWLTPKKRLLRAAHEWYDEICRNDLTNLSDAERNLFKECNAAWGPEDDRI